MVKGIEKLNIKCNLEIISLKTCFKLVHAFCGSVAGAAAHP